MKLKTINRKGFTFIEVLLVIMLIALILGISIPVSTNFFQQDNRSYDAQVITSALRHARLKAQAGEYDSNWGIYITVPSTTIFSGNSYATRDSQYDQDIPFSTASTITGDNEIVFSKRSGNTTPASIDISSNSQTITITVNNRGIITQQ